MIPTTKRTHWRRLLVATGLALATAVPAWAQTNTFPGSGPAGVGTTSPNLSGFSASWAVLTLGGAASRTGVLELASDAADAADVNVGDIAWATTALTGVADKRIAFLRGVTEGSSAGHRGGRVSLFTRQNGGSLLERFVVDNQGQVGIGTSSPNLSGFSSSWAVLTVGGPTISGGPRTGMLEFATAASDASGNIAGDVAWSASAQTGFGDKRLAYIRGETQGSAANARGGRISFVTRGDGSTLVERMVLDNQGQLGIGTSSPTYRLHVQGDAYVSGNIAAKYQDIAEWVRTGERVAGGAVVVIDEAEPNRVVLASRPYDTRVAGVVSERPGVLLGEAAEDKSKVAHSGRVRVKVDARFGAVAIGDLLVTSATPGHAMRSTPVDMGGIAVHRPGTLLGKALEPLAEGQGEILVLLMLQ
jgi:hypothetical protein